MAEQQSIRYPTACPWVNAVPVGPVLAVGAGSAQIYRVGPVLRVVVWRELETFDVSEWASPQAAYRWSRSTLRGLHREAALQ